MKTDWVTIVEYICIAAVIIVGMHCCTQLKTAKYAEKAACCKEVSVE